MRTEPGDRCHLPAEQGPCRGTFERWSYNKVEGRCQPFTYGGCKGNGNNFKSEKQCLDSCGTLTPKQICSLPRAEGPCLGRYPRYHFNRITGECQEFMYTGCEGNRNRFIDKRTCEYLCKGATSPRPRPQPLPQDVCSQPMDQGSCSSTLRRFYFNRDTRRCQPFIYGGCDGNDNRFETNEECRRACKRDRPQPSPRKGEIFLIS